MKPPLYRQAFTHSWHLAWNHHDLWPFGLFAAMLGQLGIVDIVVQLWATAQGYRPGEGLSRIVHSVWEGIVSNTLSLETLGWMGFLGAVAVGVALVGIFVALVSQGALVHSSAWSVKHRNLPDEGVSWHAGVGHVWRILMVQIFKKATIVCAGLLVAMLAYPLISSVGGSPVLFVLLFVLAAILGIVVSLISVYAVCYIVVEEQPLFVALRHAWRLFVEHWLVSLEVGAVVLLFDMLLAWLMAAVVLLSLLPAFFGYLIAILFSSGLLFMIGVGLSGLVCLVLLFLLASLFSIFTTSMWTYLFMRMHKTGIKSHILHWLGR